jgi:hypothetical protein
MEILKLKGADFGIEETKAQEIAGQFKPMLDKMIELENEYNEIMRLPKENEETAEKAGELRKKLVKVRTGTAEIHKKQKAFYLSGGRFVDAWKNAQLFASEGLEQNLLEIETYKQRIELERLQALTEKRQEMLRPYFKDFEGLNLGAMQSDVWDAYFEKKKRDFEDLQKAEKEAEEKRLEEQKREKIRYERELAIRPFYHFLNDTQSYLEISDEDFQELLKECEIHKSLIEKKAKIKEVRESMLRPFVSFLSGLNEDLSEITEEQFQDLMTKGKKAEKEFKEKMERQEAENRKLKAEAEAREKQIEAEKEKERAERARLQKELDDKREREARQEQERKDLELKEKKEAERLAKQPVKKQLEVWVNSFEIPDLNIESEKKNQIKEKFESFKRWALIEIENF